VSGQQRPMWTARVGGPTRSCEAGDTPRIDDAGRGYGYAMGAVAAHITGTVWKIECSVGDEVEEGDTVAILESMKMEMPVEAEESGTVAEILCEEGQAVSEGDALVRLQ
jgi:acetyl-CoA carboxylase biotin carboxyl carrier protein